MNEGKFTIEHLKGNQVVEEFVLTNPISTDGEDCVIDVDMSALSGNPYVVKADHALPFFQPAYNITLDNGGKKAVIEFGGDKVTYSGDLPIDESARILFDAVFCRLKPRCKTCRWYKTRAYKDCDCPKMLYGYGRVAHDQDGIAVEDDEGWGMMPGPDFGCIHHEEKQDD